MAALVCELPVTDGHRPWHVVAWGGEIDLATAPRALREVLRGARGGRSVVVDLSAVEFMDARGLGVLVRSRRALQRVGAELRVRNPPLRVRWMLTYFELDDLIEMGRAPTSLYAL